jgi:hypothetical protein
MRGVRRSPGDPRTWPVRWHLLWCKACRLRARQADEELVSLFHTQVPKLSSFDDDYEQSLTRLISGMHAVDLETEVKARSWRRHRNLVLAGTGALATCVAVLMVVVPSKRDAKLSAMTLLADAATHEEKSNLHAEPGVIFQLIRVTKGSQQFDWLVYRDRQDKRTPHFQTASARETLLRQRLADAGIPREDPLSVSSYTKWRNRLNAHNDSIAISPSGLIAVKTSTTTDSESPVREETLLLRESDYHPVSRSVTFRNAESVEIAELDYRVLNWMEVRPEWFEDLPPATTPLRQIAVHDLPVVENVKLDPSELDLAELKARLILSTHNADTNEQIDVVRAEDGIRVEGLASTPERERELKSALESVPHVVAKFATPEERKANESAPPAPTSLKVIESASQASPLLVYLRNQHRPADSYAQLSAKIMDAALRIGQQCHALRALEDEFTPRMPLDPVSRQAYEDLVGDHVAKLTTALDDQAAILSVVLGDDSPASSHIHSPISTSSNGLMTHASRTLELSKELISGQGASQRDAVLILNDLAVENSAITNALHACDASGCEVTTMRSLR